MAKLKRSLLKENVKECLVEILLEGIDSEPGAENLVEAVRPRPSPNSVRNRDTKMREIQSRRDKLDKIKVGENDKRSLISEETINGLTKDPIMNDILRDTAATTLAEQGMSTTDKKQGYVPADQYARAIQEHNPDEIFEGAGNWAALAFGNVGKK